MLEKTLPLQTLQYLNQVLGGEAVRVKPSKKSAPLPYFLQDTYEVLCGELLGQPITLACVKTNSHWLPSKWANMPSDCVSCCTHRSSSLYLTSRPVSASN